MAIVYISGPMTGLPNLNSEAFDAAEVFLKHLGHTPFNPRHLNPPGTSWHECMRRDLAAMMECDEVGLLPGWEHSKGASLEAAIAQRLNMPVYELYSGRIVYVTDVHVADPVSTGTPKISGASDETILEEAHRIVNGPRRENYNHPLDNFTGIAKLWSAFKGVEFKAEDVGLMMILVKLNREGFRHQRDSLVDIAGYAQCVQILIEEREARAR